jgi:hypothetical protein
MPFSQNDLYLTSGTASLINSWTNPVYKFDSSSFYNWEQDNLPIYDLEERDNYLFEMQGYPTSSVPGMMLTVSDCGSDDKTVFATVSGAVNALPNTIRFPIIIEVAASGQLGELKLDNLQFEGSSAGLEIINRGFAKTLCMSSTPSATVETVANASAVTLFSSIDLSNTMTDSSCLGVSQTVYQHTTSLDYWDKFTRAFTLTPEWSVDAAASERTITISAKIKDSGTGFLSSNNSYTVGIYEDFSTSSDILIYNGGDDSSVQRAPITAGDTTRATGFVYANALSNVIIKDCNGKVFVRGFCVDGASIADINDAGATQRTSVGFDVQNSDVLLENCTAARCSTAGLEAINSNVTLNRGFIAFHNYELSTGARHLDTKVLTNPTAGVRAINSNLTLSAATVDTYGLPIDSPFCAYRNTVGIDLQNSELVTPAKARKGTDMAGTSVSMNRGSQTLVLQSFYNLQEGIKAANSLIDTGERLSVFQNDIGLSLNNSECRVAEVTIDHNQNAGLLSKNSIFNYNKNATKANYTAGPFYPITSFKGNGQSAVLRSSSKFVPTYVSGMDEIYERLEFSGNHEVIMRQEGGTLRRTTLPGVVVDNGSYMEAVCARAVVESAFGNNTKYQIFNGVKGSLFQVTNNSHLKLQSHGTDNTFIFGPYLWSKQQYMTGLYAGNNSTIHVAGPTTMLQCGVNALAEDNSKIEFGPHERNGMMDASGWGLREITNQTRVQLHSTRACLVADNKSTLSMHDMGDYHQYWNPKYYDNTDSTTDPDYNEGNAFATSSFCLNGSMQFFPNAFASYTGSDRINLVPQATPLGTVSFDRTWVDLAVGTDIKDYSWGGMCVRALGDSKVAVKNVRFPAGWYNASEAYYDASADGYCAHLRIWNIADNSQLKASYLTVQTAHPLDSSGDYFGPSSVYVSGAQWSVLSGAPSSTPDTSSLSVLDSFGKGAQTNGDLGFYGKTAHENVGPFRIYVSPAAKAKFLGYPFDTTVGFFNASGGSNSMGFDFPDTATLRKGAPYQLLAQGYNPSGDCSATLGISDIDISSVYQDLGFSGTVVDRPAVLQGYNDTSSFFYTSAMLPANNEGNIWLDRSAMNTFANAKNGTLSTSGRKKIFNYYEALIDYPGEAFWANDATFGLGFGSANLFDLDRHL